MKHAFRFLRAGILLIGLAGLLVLGMERGRADPTPAKSGVELKSVKYGALVEAVKAQRGKVVVVDVWGDFCPPCKAAFPHLLELDKKYGSQGLTCISVAVDPPEGKGGALKFLEKLNATIPNYWLDEHESVWQNRWDINGPPLVFVFDRQGRRAGKFYSGPTNEPYTHEDIEKLVTKLLQAKP